MKIEQQDYTWDLNIETDESYYRGEWFLDLTQGKDILKIKKQGAKQLIEILKEFVGDENR